MAGDKIIRLYKQMADMTLEHCTRTCRRLGSCCSREYCERAIEYARDEYGVHLTRTSNHNLPLLGEEGKCTAEPHYRPLCSLHSCDINSGGYFKGEGELTVRYFALRERISKAEYKRMRRK